MLQTHVPSKEFRQFCLSVGSHLSSHSSTTCRKFLAYVFGFLTLVRAAHSSFHPSSRCQRQVRAPANSMSEYQVSRGIYLDRYLRMRSPLTIPPDNIGRAMNKKPHPRSHAFGSSTTFFAALWVASLTSLLLVHLLVTLLLPWIAVKYAHIIFYLLG